MVRIVDGSLSKVTGTGSVVITKDLILKFVLLVPNLACNLLSISKLTRDLKCVTNFFPTYCEFQDLESGRTIGNDKECEGLYLLKVPINLGKQTQNANSVSVPSSSNSSSNKNSIMLWHYRLGHPNFLYLKRMFLHFSIILMSIICNVRFVNYPSM